VEAGSGIRDAMPLVAHAGPSLMLDAAVPFALALVAVGLRRRRDRLWLLGAAAAVAVALLPPTGQWAERSVTGHMVQHLVLVLVAAPALALPLAAAPSRLRRQPTLRTLAATAATTPGILVLGAVHAVAVIAVHVPVFYDSALSSWAVHGTGHALLLVTGASWLAAVVHRAARADAVAPVVSLLVVATTGAVLGAFLMFAPDPLYAHGTVADQQVAGALMGVAGATYAAAGVVLTARTIRQLAAPRRSRVPSPGRASGRIALSVVTTAVLALAGLAVPREPSNAAAPLPVDRGEELYRRDCAWCHGVNGEGTARGIDISERGTSSVFYALSTGRMPIGEPDAAIRRGDSPYSDEEILAIVAHTSAFVTGPDVPDIAGIDGDVSAGGIRYRLLCAACHGATGEGGAQAAGSGAPSVLHANRSETASAIVAGPGQMPSFGNLAVEDVAAVAAYVEEIQDPVTTGIALPGVRVGEGLVAWLVLAVACLGFVAWTGRRV
jgi:ubiquinol-cytochrome c reductase cytochrome c subunit